MTPAAATKPPLPGERSRRRARRSAPRSSSPADGASADSPEASSSRLGPGLGEARGGRARVDIRARFATSDFRRRGRKRRFSSAENPSLCSAASCADARVRVSGRGGARDDSARVAAPRSPRSRRRGAQSLDRGSRAGDGGDSERAVESGARVTAFRSRVSSFHNLLQDSVAGRMSLRVAAQRVSAEIEARMGKFGPGGVEIYRFAWERFNRAVFFHIVFYSSLGCVLGVLTAALAFRLWTQIGHFVLRRLAYVVASLFVLAMLPPSFPNAAAHFLSLVLVGAELVLVGVNLCSGCAPRGVAEQVHPAALVPRRAQRAGGDGLGRRRPRRAPPPSPRASARRRRRARERETTTSTKIRRGSRRASADLGEGGLAWREDAEAARPAAPTTPRSCMYASVRRAAREAGDAGALGLALRTVLHRNPGVDACRGCDTRGSARRKRGGVHRGARRERGVSGRRRRGRAKRGERSTERFRLFRREENAARIESLERASVEVKETLRLVSETHAASGARRCVCPAAARWRCTTSA